MLSVAKVISHAFDAKELRTLSDARLIKFKKACMHNLHSTDAFMMRTMTYEDIPSRIRPLVKNMKQNIKLIHDEIKRREIK